MSPSSMLPPGVKNYLTVRGERALRNELERLLEVDRPRLAAAVEPSAAATLRALDQRLQAVRQSLLCAEVIPPPEGPWDRVTFGATVTVRDRLGVESRYRLVGLDEVDLDRGWVSWRSPLAKALLNARLGSRVRFTYPSGDKDLEIVTIRYE